MTNLEIIKQSYADFATGNLEGVLAVYDPSIEWHECKSFPYSVGDGIYTGIQAIIANVFSHLPVYFNGFNIQVTEIFGADDKVVMAGYYQGTYQPTGHSFKANATHVWTLQNGKVIRFFQAVDTAAIMG